MKRPTTIRFNDNRVMTIGYVYIEIPTAFPRRERRFRPAWRCY